jgi:penicillin V acylase-like amidase (Ntn superfamily)
MEQKSVIILSLVVVMIFSSPQAYQCTTFVLHNGNRLVFGRNLDWITGTGLVMVNPRNLEKVALFDPSEKPVKWISKFGSITFNQVGRDLPYGGVNESGLAVSLFDHISKKTEMLEMDHYANKY